MIKVLFICHGRESENEVLGGLWRLKCGKSGWER